jgi:pimeloyl-ACP methyl ester carboxylesterase
MFGRSSRFAMLAFLSVGLVACSSGTTASQPTPASASPAPSQATVTASPALPTPTAAPTPTPAPGTGAVVYDGRIDVGGGRKLEVKCFGVGAPTILLEGGGIAPGIDAYPSIFAAKLGDTTTTCQYSQAGARSSSDLPGPRTMAAVVGDAYALLGALKQAAGVPDPYIFVGWSFGGGVALAEALAHPDQTKGLVILDTDFIVDFMKICVASGRSRADCQKEYDGDIEAKSLEKELVPTIHPLPDIPLRIVSAMQFPDCDPSDPSTLKASIGGHDVKAKDCADLAKQIADLQQKGWRTVNPKLEQTRVDAGHDGLIDQAGDQIAAIILDLVAQARSAT